jgi:hypothetical protein
MALKIINGVSFTQNVITSRMGVISEERASASDGLDVNHNYEDLRGYSQTDLEDVLAFETETFIRLEVAHFDADSVATADEEWYESFLLPGVDFGIGSTVIALSALGCTPITSCRGNSLTDGHRHECPTVCFYATKGLVPLLLQLAGSVGVSLENNSDMLEIYAADVRSMVAFAKEVSRHLSEE